MRLALVIALALSLAACGKSSDPPAGGKGSDPATGGGASAGLDIKGFCERTMESANPAQCWGKDAQSQKIKTSMCVELLGGAQGDGRIEIDAAALAACERAALAALATLDNQRGISDLAERFPECRTVTTGKVPAGEECLGTMECAPGLVCTGMMCRPPRKDGDECRMVIELTMAVVESDCGDGLYCDLADSKCHPRVAADGACRSTEACASGLRCRGDRCVAAAPSKPGEECDDHADCPTGHFCALGGETCEPLKADGESCMLDPECQHQCVTGSSVSGACGPC